MDTLPLDLQYLSAEKVKSYWIQYLLQPDWMTFESFVRQQLSGEQK